MKATRDWFGEALVSEGERDPRVVVVNCDLGSATKTLRFRDRFPARFIEGGIAEANAISVAAGLALEGFRPFVASFGHFLTGKFLEIHQSVGLNNAGVVLVGTHAGLAIGKDGPTQMGLRDLALMRTLPNMSIHHPVDGAETSQVVGHLARGSGPAYLRLCRQPQPEVHAPDFVFRPGSIDVVREGAELLVISMGGPVPVAVAAFDGGASAIRPTIVNLSTLPFDAAQLLQLTRGHRACLVVEDHYQRGGLADEVARVLVEADAHLPFDVLAVPDYGQSADPTDLYRRYGLDQAGILRRAEDLLTATRSRQTNPKEA